MQTPANLQLTMQQVFPENTYAILSADHRSFWSVAPFTNMV